MYISVLIGIVISSLHTNLDVLVNIDFHELLYSLILCTLIRDLNITYSQFSDACSNI